MSIQDSLRGKDDRSVTTNRPTLQRLSFTTSRELEFFTQKELQLQIGHAPALWPLALVKELIDNALDACESAGTPPVISVSCTPNTISVQDNGPGVPETTLSRSLDYQVRVSDKQHYVSPTRGQLGNALKCLWAAPFVVSGERGDVIVQANGTRYAISVTVDRIAQAPRLTMESTPDPTVKSGTCITVLWPNVASCLDGAEASGSYRGRPSLPCLLRDFSLCNPHAAFHLYGLGAPLEFPVSLPSWRKWSPSDPTSPHWYTVETLAQLILGYLAAERNGQPARTVRDLVGEFNGLSGTSKRKVVLEMAGLSGAWLRDLVHDGDVDHATVERLLAAMQAAARPVQPDALGILGEAHLRRHLVEQYGAAPNGVTYRRAKGTADGLPYLLECGFGITDGPHRRSVALNWSPTLRSPLQLLDSLLGAARVQPYDPVVFVLHLAFSRLPYLDRGKATLVLPEALATALESLVTGITRRWTAAKRQADREDRLDAQALKRLEKLHQTRPSTIKQAANQVMAEAYQLTSDNGRLPANARQIMYAARPLILALTDGTIWSDDGYFTQRLLPDYLRDHADETSDWDVIFDARGHLHEPHTGHVIDLGTLAVRQYIARWTGQISAQPILSFSTDCPTSGPAHRYRFVLFVEKEGFTPLLEAGRIAERFDLAIMSTKGMSVTAARTLVAALSAEDVTILVIRDLDKAGFSIAYTLAHDTRRFQYTHPPRVIDLGLRLTDAERMGLASEPVSYDSKQDPRVLLRNQRATEAECQLLVAGQTQRRQWTGQRIELNAMTSRQFLDWLEAKLRDAGATKYVPNGDALTAAYRRTVRLKAASEAAQQIRAKLTDETLPVPDDLPQQIEALLAEDPALAWDEAVAQLAQAKGAAS